MCLKQLRVLACAGLLTLLAGDTAVTQLPLGLRQGALTGGVASRSYPSQRYAVYLPPQFNPRVPTPVLFVLDYRGRARVAAEVFQPAAARFGWVVMSSNNSASDEAARTTVAALQAMWTDAHDFFTVDERRRYIAGLSGTARTATWAATNAPGTVAGVIGAAAGFSPLSAPSPATDFLYFGTVGDADYNYWEMRALDRRLDELDRPHRIEQFTGGHGWMPRPLAMNAIEWMELRAMQSGRRARDEDLVRALWMRDLHDVDTLEEAGRPLAAWRRLRAIERDYHGLRPEADLARIGTRSDRLSRLPSLLPDADREARALEAHDARIAAALRVVGLAFPPGAPAPVHPLDRTLAEVGVPALLAAAASPHRDTALDARRLLAELEVRTGFYLPVEAMQAGDDARAAFLLDVAKAINPNDSYAWFLRGKIFARATRTIEAMDALRRAVRHGFRTLDALEHDPAFDPLRGRPDFTRLVDQVRALWDYDR